MVAQENDYHCIRGVAKDKVLINFPSRRSRATCWSTALPNRSNSWRVTPYSRMAYEHSSTASTSAFPKAMVASHEAWPSASCSLVARSDVFPMSGRQRRNPKSEGRNPKAEIAKLSGIGSALKCPDRDRSPVAAPRTAGWVVRVMRDLG